MASRKAKVKASAIATEAKPKYASFFAWKSPFDYMHDDVREGINFFIGIMDAKNGYLKSRDPDRLATRKLLHQQLGGGQSDLEVICSRVAEAVFSCSVTPSLKELYEKHYRSRDGISENVIREYLVRVGNSLFNIDPKHARYIGLGSIGREINTFKAIAMSEANSLRRTTLELSQRLNDPRRALT